ncbi:MAG: hypothetical protein H0U85_09810 [Gemmatimonadales bacterium]|nr:hypothetical protein [Gemmatimonadales bacterium]
MDEKNLKHTPSTDADSQKNTSKPAESVELGGEELEPRIAPMTFNG